jgi:hypothetical protein
LAFLKGLNHTIITSGRHVTETFELKFSKFQIGVGYRRTAVIGGRLGRRGGKT